MKLILLTLVLCASNILASDYYLSPDGAGNKDGSSQENAFAQSEVSSIVNQTLQPGDTLLICPGTYENFSLNISRGGEKNLPICIKGVGEGKGFPVLRGVWSADKPDKGSKLICIDHDVSYLEISDLLLDNFVFGIYASGAKEKALRTNLKLKNISLRNFRYGFYLSDCSQLLVEDCSFKRYTKHAFRLEQRCSNVTVKRCVADCTEGDQGWAKKTELFPFGFQVNKRGSGSTGIVFEDCLAQNNLMPLQKKHYKNGDGFVVEENVSDVSFFRCRAISNQDGGFDLKVPDLVMKDCVALRNSRNFRVWRNGVMENCIAVGGGTGIWNNGGPLLVKNSTIADVSGSAVQSDDKSKYPITLENCILSGFKYATRKTSRGPFEIKNCVVDKKDGEARDPEFVKRDPNWNGLGDAMNSRTYPDKGYHKSL